MNKKYKGIKNIFFKLQNLLLITGLIAIPFKGIDFLLITILTTSWVRAVFYTIDMSIDKYKKTTKNKLLIEEYKTIDYEKRYNKIKKSKYQSYARHSSLTTIDKIKRIEEKIKVTNNKSELNKLKTELTLLQFQLKDYLSENEEIIDRQDKINNANIPNIIDTPRKKIKTL